MKSMKKTTGILAVFLSLVLFSFGSAQAVEPSLVDVRLNPTQPTKLSTITFTVEIAGEAIEAVHIGVKECNEAICEAKLPDNISMILTEEGTYVADVVLDFNLATYITYYVHVKSHGTWTTLPSRHGVDVTLSEHPQNGNTNGNATNGDNSPGFELVILITAIAGIVIILGRKRSK